MFTSFTSLENFIAGNGIDSNSYSLGMITHIALHFLPILVLTTNSLHNTMHVFDFWTNHFLSKSFTVDVRAVRRSRNEPFWPGGICHIEPFTIATAR
jgi:hypothetical protein